MSTIQRVLLNTGAVLGSLCLIMTVLTLVFGLKPLIFASGSMGPDIPTGSLGIAAPTAVGDIYPGEIVSVVNSGEQRVTHRVIEKTAKGLILQGDANPVPDLEVYQVNTADRLIFSIPTLGYVVSWLSKPWAFFAGGLLCAYLFYTAFRKNDDPSGGERQRDDKNVLSAQNLDHQDAAWQRKDGRKYNSRITVGIMVFALVATFGIQNHTVEPTQAAFIGVAESKAKPSATVMQPVSNLKCTNQTNRKIRFSWDAPPAQADTLAGYKVAVEINGTVQESEQLLPANVRTHEMDISNSTGLLGILLGLLGNLLGATFDVKFAVTSVYTSGWSSITQTHTAKGYIAPLNLTRTLSCS
ncbi:signal peptidase I [Arthrobacter sp. MYb213]|uniref:signal peptidase I n=1 Tax=Arthrobacter sp. MYb213 TaxID=1848595 RepID=UPI002570FD20|nr:signal peptidase I [Arthrobacter sp. MYb213]